MGRQLGSTRRQAIGVGLTVTVAASAVPLATAAVPAAAPQHAVPRRERDPAAYEAAYLRSVLAIRRAETQMHRLFADILDRAGRSDVEAGDLVIMFDATEGGQSQLLNSWVWSDERARRRKRAMVKKGLIMAKSAAGRQLYAPTEAGQALLDRVNRALTIQSRLADPIGGLGVEALEEACQTVARAERWWIDIVRYRLG
ncbi:hypothetical protein IP69_07960 [Bosea sp. AAP35]|uniref:hypothetical protein n=1 Tax=Bosea sp. AAP35 TaxID=1523417 RepID=UPI0006B991CF|nr:hypothetical protein [Bosea sp. AAP35]KPF71209.1 hypothetical protein IP69_07960 [Bosea sp. AAP35]